jgi:hypothetical protein
MSTCGKVTGFTVSAAIGTGFLALGENIWHTAATAEICYDNAKAHGCHISTTGDQKGIGIMLMAIGGLVALPAAGAFFYYGGKAVSSGVSACVKRQAPPPPPDDLEMV